ncbi:S-layer homology domain-containing protein [Lysinibacillus capsici]|uniref:S-layer homology domain-containing protein n=1 Tax=Lysinibacillus capsici TaxID=2115968 RepID=UPI002730DF85|nr:S-layer homology domain-containing protein [Lysinibacillus capsici]MDP1396060.1 S-layer homology domain-containing protein [Lysinibacillus capsici]MDP1416522.1 S-layer homology domain-containing protein [Lysinibacillus capsici]MDP1432534.1 S-layer homology domain-containing protein [Lysinibacillus capsici]
MDKSKIQKVNKALIATVFASSGIAVVVPPPNAAAATSPFTDINQYSDNYNEILKLYSQGVMSGFADNTFRPDVSVTRGEAAKMLATALKLDTKNIQDPYYKDVPKGNQYYKYVAALQNAGIMSGYSNGMFMPNEVLTRGELAKMVVVGFHLEVSPTYNNIFKDVNSKTNNAIYIQTLIDLNITKGTTPVTFSPFDPVTRGQFASFVVGSQEKKSNETSYKITNVDDDAVYINGQSYTIPESLAHIFNEYNAPVLKGAFIEGDLSSKGIRSISKLTLNASGTSTRSLDFDGNYGSFGATIVVNGNYIEFSNMTLTGTMFVNETVRPPLHLGATYNQPLALGRVASNNISFINWSNPDNNKGDDSSNNNSNDLQNWTKPNTENDKPFVNWSKEKEEMKNVEKYLEFYNSSVSRLVVSQTGTKIETNTKLPRVDIIGNVREFEIQGDIGTLNLNTETKLTIYGSGNIDWINYNSYTDLELYIDGRIGTLFVDNSYGKIDIGDYTYIDKVILPKDGSPNNIFDDFLDDKDNIGNITDPDGKPIDKEENENQNPDDKTKPIISITNVKVLNGSEIQADFTSDEVGTYYYIVREKGAEAPNKSEMVNRLSNKNVAHGTAAAIKGTNSIKVSNLGEKKEYVIYIMVVDGSKNASDIVSQEFQMKDASPPVVKSLQVTPLHGGTRAEFTFTASEPGDYYYYIRKKTTATDPTTADIVANSTGKGQAKADELGIKGILTGLDAETEYQLYVVMKDNSGNFSIDPPAVKDFKTGALDSVHPYVEQGKLVRKSNNQFELTVSEALDPESANDINNYLLTGTVIVNVTGEKGIKPSAVEYKAGDKKVLLTIPSDTGFVNGDTLRVTVLPGVKDLADNAFENTGTVKPGDPVRNYAEYRHEDTVMPVITIENTINKADESDGFRRAEIEFKPNKAGTYYYMILPNTVIDNGETKTFQQYLTDHKITERDFINEFAGDTGKSGYFQIGGKDIYIQRGSGTADLETATQKFPVSVEQNKLDPFNSYSIYMVLRDRGGELSKIAGPKTVFEDTKAPLIRNLEIKPKENDDTKATISFETNETAKVHYWFVEKRIKDKDGILIDNPDANLTAPADEKYLETKLKSSPSVEKIGKGLSGTVDARGVTLKPHTEYVVYVGAEDTPGNFTIYKANVPYNDHDKTSTGLMKQDFYSDGTPPSIGMVSPLDNKYYPGLIYRNSDDTFTITFSETIMRDENGKSKLVSTGDTVVVNLADIMTITTKDSNGNEIDVTAKYAPVTYTTGTDTTKASKLIIKSKTSNDANQTITVTMKDSTRDFVIPGYEGHKFVDKAQYLYRTLDAKFMEIKLGYLNTSGDDRKVQATFDLLGSAQQFYENGESLKYYYLSDTAGTNETVIANRTPSQVIQAVVHGTDSSLAKGTGTVATNVARVTKELTHPAKFFNGDWVTIVLEDKYGNFHKFYAKVGYKDPSIQ